MRVLGFSLALLIATGMAAFANGASPVQARILPDATNQRTATANCPRGNSYADGCRRAQAGTPQNPHLLDIYGVHRPPWNVAGVDYAVGESGAMQDVTTATLPSCATYTISTNTVDIISAPCVLDHYDFALHNSTCLVIDSSITNGALVTLTNNHFKGGASLGVCSLGRSLVTVSGAVQLLAEYNTFDGNYDLNIQYAVGNSTSANGNETFKYNYLLHCPEACFTLDANGTYAIQSNYIQGICSPANCNSVTDGGGFHGDFWIVNNFVTPGTNTVVHSSFNTVYLDQTNGTFMSTLCYMTPGPHSGTLSFSGYCKNETYIGRAGYWVGGIPIRVAPTDVGQGPFSIENNYIDPTDFASPTLIIESDNSDGTSSSVTCKGNVNMVDGSTIPVVPASGTTTFFTCN